MQESQMCSSCKTWKSTGDFYKSSRGKSGAWCIACMRAWHRLRYQTDETDEPRACAHCATIYTPRQRRASAYCGRTCKDAAKNARRKAEREASKPARQCLQCGADMPQSMRSEAKFCSTDCNESAHQLQRNLRARGGFNEEPGYIRAAICKRDKWTCGICHLPVDRTLKHPDPMCASLDHVVPVAHGGTSDPANLRLTHLVCNLRRGDRGGLEQLAIV